MATTETNATSAAPGETIDAPTTPATPTAIEGAFAFARAIGRDARPRDGDVAAANLGTAIPVAERPTLLKATTPGEKRYADGRIKTTDAAGRETCVQEPPEFAYTRGGVLPRMGVSTNCP